jgi:hypothetical protein
MRPTTLAAFKQGPEIFIACEFAATERAIESVFAKDSL